MEEKRSREDDKRTFMQTTHDCVYCVRETYNVIIIYFIISQLRNILSPVHTTQRRSGEGEVQWRGGAVNRWEGAVCLRLCVYQKVCVWG